MGVFCDYCGKKTYFIKRSRIQQNAKGSIYRCYKCDAHVGVHKGSRQPLGSLAKSNLRSLRWWCHYYFDFLWKLKNKMHKNRKRVRSDAYAWLAKEMGIEENFCHIAMFREKDCEICISICKPIHDKIKLKMNGD